MKRLRLFLFVCAIFTAVIAVTAGYALNSLMDEESPSVTFLYTQRTIFPNIVFRLSAVPIALATRFKYGKPSLRVAGITAKEVQTAFKQSAMLIIGTHGNEEGFATDDGKIIGPDHSIYPQMHTLFFGSCNVGRRLPDWQRVFPMAKIISYSREMMEYEGWLYLVFGAQKDLLNRD